MKCIKCHKVIADGMYSCPFCGAIQTVSTEQPIQTTIPQNMPQAGTVQVPISPSPIPEREDAPNANLPLQNITTSNQAMQQTNTINMENQAAYIPMEPVIKENNENIPVQNVENISPRTGTTAPIQPVPEAKEPEKESKTDAEKQDGEVAPEKKEKKKRFGRKKKEPETTNQDDKYYESTEPEVKDSWPKTMTSYILKVGAVALFVVSTFLYFMYVS